MRISIDWGPPTLDPAFLERFDMLAQLVQEGMDEMAGELESLKREVQESREVQQGAIVLLQGLSARILEIQNNPNALMDLAAELDSQQAALAAAITANTPVDAPTRPKPPAPGPAPTEPPSPAPEPTVT